MLALNYNSILSSQYQEKKRGYKLILSFYFLIHSFFSTKWLIKRINKEWTNQLLSLKGTYAYLIESASQLKGQNLRSEIVLIEKTIKELYAIEASIEKHLTNPDFSELKITHEIISEILEVMHETLRLLKKNTLKTPLTETSEEAKIAIEHSNKTMNKILYGR
jgi:hypothetical protein